MRLFPATLLPNTENFASKNRAGILAPLKGLPIALFSPRRETLVTPQVSTPFWHVDIVFKKRVYITRIVDIKSINTYLQ